MNRIFTLLTSAALATGVFAQINDARAVIDRTQNDLRRAEDFERQKHKELTRYDNAQKHLSEFDRDYTKGHFDKGKLDASINDLKNVVEHNTLNPQDRDALSADLRDLRLVRADRH
jgi:ATP/maltotriose-dependent transcriptional regulator MalT